MYEAPICDVAVLMDTVQASKNPHRWETPIDKD